MLQLEIIGHIGADAELKDFNGRKFLSFRVAHSERFTDAGGNVHERTTWVSCLKNVQGESKLLPFLKKGTQVYVRGDLNVKMFQGQSGQQIGVNCNIRDLQLLSSNKQPQPQQPQSQPQPQRSPVYGGQQPQQPQQTQAQAPQQQGGDPFSGNGGIDGYWGGLPY